MSVIYHCAHCGNVLAKLTGEYYDAEKLGLTMLSEEDQHRLIKMKDNGDVMIQTICECCEETLMTYPEYHRLDYFIH